MSVVEILQTSTEYEILNPQTIYSPLKTFIPTSPLMSRIHPLLHINWLQYKISGGILLINREIIIISQK